MRVDALSPDHAAQAAALAARLALPLGGEAEFALQLGATGWQLADLGPGAPGPVRVDFAEGAVAHRRLHGGGLGQMIAKAVGLQPGIRPRVLDATAGLGRDAFVLAQLGCEVTLLERQPVVHLLLADGLARGRDDAELRPILDRMPLQAGDAIDGLRHWPGDPPQVIYLDPMFPERDKRALVKKEMRLFHALVGGDDDAPQLLSAALALATHRVVVKRPRKAPPLEGPTPGYTLEGKACRYDIYPKRSLRGGSSAG